MKFDVHVRSIISRCIGKIRLLFKNVFHLSKETKLLLYNALISPHLNYCDEVWTHAISSELVSKLETVQNAAMRFILGIKDLRFPISTMKDQLGWLSLKEKRNIHYLTMCWLSASDFAGSPAYLREMFQRTSSLHGHNTRTRYHIPRMRTNMSKTSFKLYGPSLYNRLPLEVRDSPSIEVFRKKILQFIKNNEQFI